MVIIVQYVFETKATQILDSRIKILDSRLRILDSRIQILDSRLQNHTFIIKTGRSYLPVHLYTYVPYGSWGHVCLAPAGGPMDRGGMSA